MTALAPAASRLADPWQVFLAQCQARALLFVACEYELHDAVDGLHAAAIKLGLVDQIGWDSIQAIMAETFASVRQLDRPLDLQDDVQPDPADEYAGLGHGFGWACRMADAERLIKHGNLQLLDHWLASRPERERALLIKRIRTSRA
jgi:hypothetical protein